MDRQPRDAARQRAAGVLRRAAEEAGRAPSLLNTQPWRWHLGGDVLELHADLSRQVGSIDPRRRLLTLSCGAALHHARVALAAAGHEPVVQRLPDRRRPLLLARVRAREPHPVTRDDLVRYESMRCRRTDRRPFRAAVPVPAETIAALEATADAEHASLYRIEPDDLDLLRHTAERAQAIDAGDELPVAEQRAWTHRDPGTGDGVPADTVVARAARPVPLRDFALGEEATLPPGPGDDRWASYFVVATEGDRPLDWLVAGEAASAVWLAATAEGLVMSPMSDVVEKLGARALLGTLIDPPARPQLVLRAGVDVNPVPPPASPRRPPRDVIDV
ncbi:nitroreductase [Dactylosporangium sp. NPDC000244]|uniref:Acg family FMN-binding oxidoreductase n=1 Tax=Dactylosporangium sp. NPDC000244 TaxID=3154365 RepID=UPI0033348362